MMNINLNGWLAGALRRLRGEEGGVLPLVAFALVVLVGFVALAVDWGQLHEDRRQLQNAVDAAAVAGANELLPPLADGSQDIAKAEAVARDYVVRNGVTDVAPVVTVTCTFTCGMGLMDTVTVRIQHNKTMYFAGVLGQPQKPVSARATGIVGSVGGVRCPLPLAVLQHPPGWQPGDPLFKPYPYVYTIKFGSAGIEVVGGPGSFGGMDLYDPQDYFDAVAGDCPDDQPPPREGEDYDPRTGVQGNRFVRSILERTASEPVPWTAILTDYAYQEGDAWYPIGGPDWEAVSPRFAYLPVFEYSDYDACTGSSCDIVLQKWALFFLTSLGCIDRITGDYVATWDASCPPGQTAVQGQFVMPVNDTGQIFGRWWGDSGTKMVRLWQ